MYKRIFEKAFMLPYEVDRQDRPILFDLVKRWTDEDGNSMYSHLYEMHFGDEEYVDLGLPSGTLWSTKNLGAKNTDEFGDFYAWGETAPKKEFSKENYKFYRKNRITKYSLKDHKFFLDKEDDAAYSKLGIMWRIPTLLQCAELKDHCTWHLALSKSGTEGVVGVGPNGNAIFFPYCEYDTKDGIITTQGAIASSHLNAEFGPRHFYPLCFDMWTIGFGFGDRYYGVSVRPVMQ